ncbi:MAG: zinc-binding dehydrogenase, partial [Xanthomonadales bacterium]|nr:zinc-binding dehydrogenase [Xanthomonadales bacterium]
EVMAIVSGGSYAELITVPERQLMPVPSGVAVADAAAIPEVGITAHDALVVQGGLTAGGWALVHAGASGVGSMAVQIVKSMGGRVVTTTSAAKVDAVAALGADRVVDYGIEDFVDACAEATGGRGIDAVLDVVGGDYLARNVRAVRVGGRIVQVGVMAGGRTDVDLGQLMFKRVSLIGTVLRARPLEQKIDA